MFYPTTIIVWALWTLWCIAITAEVVTGQQELYAVVVDAGSTGSRGFVYKLRFSSDGQTRASISAESCGKVRPGLSSFVSNPEAVVEYFMPLIIQAKSLVPTQHLHDTALYIKGTAGMRILSDDEQYRLWQEVERGLRAHADVPFVVAAPNLGTISGHMEAFYAVLASNYIAGSIDADLMPTGVPMIGALDMGGSSNQLVIYNASESSEKVQSTDFWSHSWLHYGVERIRERVLHYMRTLHQQGPDEADDATVAASMLDIDNDPSIGTNTVNINNASNYEELVDAVVGRIPNPCSLVDSEDLYNGKWIFHGTGDAQKCLDIIEKVVWPQRNELVEVEIGMDGTVDEQTCTTPPCAVNSVIHPSVVGHEFYAMSVYFYALDFIRSFGPHPLPNWPNPTLRELKDAVFDFCALEWKTVKEDYLENKHPYTKEFQLPHRCLEGLYIVLLLEKGFGFHPDDRQITVALEIQGNEVEWTMGFVLAELKSFTAAEKQSPYST